MHKHRFNDDNGDDGGDNFNLAMASINFAKIFLQFIISKLITAERLLARRNTHKNCI